MSWPRGRACQWYLPAMAPRTTCAWKTWMKTLSLSRMRHPHVRLPLRDVN